MLTLVHGPQGPNLLGPRQPCIICREPTCLREQLACDKCNKFCWICSSTKADENCDRWALAGRRRRAPGQGDAEEDKDAGEARQVRGQN